MFALEDSSVPVVAEECLRTSMSTSGCCACCIVVLLLSHPTSSETPVTLTNAQWAFLTKYSFRVSSEQSHVKESSISEPRDLK